MYNFCKIQVRPQKYFSVRTVKLKKTANKPLRVKKTHVRPFNMKLHPSAG